MKTLLLALATLTAGVGSAHAGLFSPSVVPGAIIGGTAGAIIGNNSGAHRGAEGAVIGAIAGSIIGATIDNDRCDSRVVCETPVTYAPSCEPTVVYRAPAPRVVYVPAPRRVIYAPRHEVIYAPRREVIVRHDVRVDHREARRDNRDYRHGHR